MPSISRQLPSHYALDIKGVSYGLRAVAYPDDLALLHNWMHRPHVVPQWQLDVPAAKLAAHFEVMLADDHQRLYLVMLDERPVGYVEIYEGYRDRLARYYQADINDLGWHLLIGEEDIVGHGHLKPIVVMLSSFIFGHSPATRIVGEPDVRVKAYSVTAEALSYVPQRELPMPEKTAMLYYCVKEAFLVSRYYLEHVAETA